MNTYDLIPFGFATLVVLIAWLRDRQRSGQG
jgi:hypothetical protein